MSTAHFVAWLVASAGLVAATALLGSRRALRTMAVLSVLGAVSVLAAVGARAGSDAAGAGEGRRITGLVVDGGQEVVNHTVGRVLPGDVGLDLTAAAALLLLAVAAYRCAEIANARRTPGPVAVLPFRRADGTGGDGAGSEAGEELGAIEARFRQRLADANVLPPPSVPGGSDQQELLDVVQQTPLVGASAVARVLAVAAKMAIPKVGYTLTGTVVSDADTGGRGLVVTLTDVRTSSTVAVRTFLDETCDKAADKAAYFVSQKLLARCTTVPPWQQWQDSRSLEAYESGRRAVEDQDWARARSAFREACVLSPNNVHLRLELAAVHLLEPRDERELQECYEEALLCYLSVLRRHPRLVEARYRLAVTYVMADSWYRALPDERHPAGRLRRLSGEHHRRRSEEPPFEAEDVEESRRRFYALALREHGRLKRDLRLLPFVIWRVRSAHRRLIGDTPLLTSPTRVVLGPRVPMLRTIEVAGMIATLKHMRLDRQPSEPSTTEELLQDRLERLLRRRRVGWQARYNAACFYALRMSDPPVEPDDATRRRWETDNDAAATRSVELLSEVFLDPANEFSADPAWILEKDGDLARLRPHFRFEDWKMEMGLDARGSMRRAEMEERDGLSRAWHRLALLVGGLVAPPPAGAGAPAPAPLAPQQQRLWAALATWARRPLEDERWRAFRDIVVAEQPHVSSLPLDGEPACRPDYRDPADVASRSRASWRKLAEASEQLSAAWGARLASPAGNGNRGQNPGHGDWPGEARSLWESLARWSRKPMSQPLQEEFDALAQEIRGPRAQPAVRPSGKRKEPA